MIEIENLTKYYGDAAPAVDRVSFQAVPGEILGFLGPNGAGKSTTIRVLACYLAASSGSARVAGHDVATESMEVRRKLGYLPESNPLYEDMRVTEFLDFRARLKGVGSRPDRRRVVGRICELCWIDDVSHKIIGHLSKGYRQRVGLADALLADPPVVILDEPTVGLDPHQVRQVRRIIRELGEKKTVLFSTHILSEVEELCDRIVIISQGRIVANGSHDEVLASMKGKRSLQAVVEGPREDVQAALRRVDGVFAADIRRWKGDRSTLVLWADEEVKGLEDRIRTLCKDRKWALDGLDPMTPDLEDLFVVLTRGESVRSESVLGGAAREGAA